MTIRWRLSVLAVQLLLLGGVAWWVTGTFLPFSVWFVSGAIGVVLALQLTEPFFSRPTDVVVSGVSVILIVLVADRESFETAWWAIGGYALVGVSVAVVAMVAGREQRAVAARKVGASARAYQLVRAFSGKILYSAVFVVAVLTEFADRLEFALPLGLAWAAVIVISSVRWDKVFGSTLSRRGDVFGFVSPARILVAVSDSDLRVGQSVVVRYGRSDAEAYVTRRLRRMNDVLLELQLDSFDVAENLLGKEVSVGATSGIDRIAGVVSTDSTSDFAVFYPFERVEIGSAILGRSHDGREILHQVSEIQLVEERESSQIGEQRFRAIASQIGMVEPDGRLTLSRGVLGPGAPLWRYVARAQHPVERDPYEFELGTVLDTDLPVWMDTKRLVEGHVSILGMTRMGKSSFARRLASHLAERFPVIVVDQTGEYRGMNLPLASSGNVSTNGLYLKDLESTDTPHKEALKVLKELEKVGRGEYANGTVRRRVLILEEAHQFIPEPSLLGFGAPGRDESIEFGLRMMQVRKYGVSIVVISQRTAVVAKSALSQCENIVAFKSVDQTGLEYLEAVGGSSVRSILPRLAQGEAVVMGTAVSAQRAVAVDLVYEPPAVTGPTSRDAPDF